MINREVPKKYGRASEKGKKSKGTQYKMMTRDLNRIYRLLVDPSFFNNASI